MSRASLAVSILLSSSLLLVAQSTTQTAPPGPTPTEDPSLSSCPVSLHALQGSGNGLLAVRNAQPTSVPLQHIHLILGARNTTRPVSGQIVVHGLSGKSQTIPTQLSNAERFDQTRNLNVTFTAQNDNEVAVNLSLPGFTSISSIHLQSIDYSDGSTWKIASGQICRVVPDPLMLVANQ